MRNKILQHCSLLFVLCQILFSSCTDQPAGTQPDEAFLKSLKEQPIERTGFSISIPPDYHITMTQGPDFDVYYFTPVDSTKEAAFSGGMYMGNAPSTFEPPNDSCQIQARSSRILDEKETWMVFKCNEVYSVQVLIKNEKNEGWNEYIHAFGSGISLADVNKLFAVYATMRRQTKI